MNSMQSVTASSGCVGRTRTGGCARPLISKNVSYFNFNEEKSAYPSTSCWSCGFCWEGSAARGCVQSYLEPGVIRVTCSQGMCSVSPAARGCAQNQSYLQPGVPRLTCSQGIAMPRSLRCCHGCDKNISFHTQGSAPRHQKEKTRMCQTLSLREEAAGIFAQNPWISPRGVSHLSELPAKPGQEPKVS